MIPRVAYPLALTTFRLLAGPVMILLALWAPDGVPLRVTLVSLLWLGMISDILDGIVARKFKVATPLLRRFDSQTDIVFWLCVIGASFVLRWSVLRPHGWQIVVIATLEVTSYAVSLMKFRKETCTHAYLAKLWGLMLLATFSAILGWAWTGWLFDAMFVVGVLADVDVILITLTLKRWEADVPSVYHAWRLRRGLPVKRYSLFHSAHGPTSG